jgi:alkylation response protein AidB-like acyl-CoA dehydrogenase
VSDIISAADALSPIARGAADRAERERRLPEEVVRGLIDAGIPNMLVPQAIGGGEVHPLTFLEVTERLAVADAAAAWCGMIAATSGLPSAYMDADSARELYGPDDVAGGALAPRGAATPVEGGYQVSGRWPFNSGCEHCTLLMGGTMIARDSAHEFRLMLFPAGDAEILDTWSVSGLCGTGSHDIEVRDLFVPDARAVSLAGPPTQPGPLYVFPLFGLLAIGVAAVALGIARGAIDDLCTLAGAKTPTLSTRKLAERPSTQAAVASTEAALRAARAYLVEAIEDAWDAAVNAGRIELSQRALLRAASTHATRSSAEIVDRMYDAGGGTSIYTKSPLQRRFRDVHAATQHMVIAPATYELAGRVLLGLETDASQL